MLLACVAYGKEASLLPEGRDIEWKETKAWLIKASFGLVGDLKGEIGALYEWFSISGC